MPPAGHGGGHRQSLRRHAGSGGRAAWRGGLDGHRQRTQVRLECRRGGQGGLGRHSGRYTGTAQPAANYGNGKVASAGIPAPDRLRSSRRLRNAATTNLEVLSKPPVQYTSEARQLKVQGDVVLRVTFTASGQVVVQGVVRGLGHGLDEEARRVAQQIRFRPATRNGQAGGFDHNITITFQLA
jgi:TonB family protein